MRDPEVGGYGFKRDLPEYIGTKGDHRLIAFGGAALEHRRFTFEHEQLLEQHVASPAGDNASDAAASRSYLSRYV